MRILLVLRRGSKAGQYIMIPRYKVQCVRANVAFSRFFRQENRKTSLYPIHVFLVEGEPVRQTHCVPCMKSVRMFIFYRWIIERTYW